MFDEFFRHHLWANLALLDLCAPLGDGVLDATGAGTYGSGRDTIVHLFASEERYVARITGVTPASPLSEDAPFPGIALIRERAQASGAALLAAVAGDDPARELRGEYRERERTVTYSMPLIVRLVQAINHATEHRTHVLTIVSQHGIDVPTLDEWNHATTQSR